MAKGLRLAGIVLLATMAAAMSLSIIVTAAAQLAFLFHLH